MNPDPLALHDAGQGDLNLYAYVRGMVLAAIDPLGLEEKMCKAPSPHAPPGTTEKPIVDPSVKAADPAKFESPRPAGTDMRTPNERLADGLQAATTTGILSAPIVAVFALTGDRAQFERLQGLNANVTELGAATALTREQKGARPFVQLGPADVTGRRSSSLNSSAERRSQAGLASTAAKDAQGKGFYPGVDGWTDTMLRPGQMVVQGAPGASSFYTTLGALSDSQGSATSLFQGLQVAQRSRGYRPGATVSVVTRDTPAAAGVARANPQAGPGGHPQFFIPDTKSLAPVLSIPLKK